MAYTVLRGTKDALELGICVEPASVCVRRATGMLLSLRKRSELGRVDGQSMLGDRRFSVGDVTLMG